MIRSKKITDSARNAPCTLNIVGVCNHDSTTTVYAHIPDEYKGVGYKSSDLSGCYACSSCHDVIDGRTNNKEYSDRKEFYLFRAWRRTLFMLIEKDILYVA